MEPEEEQTPTALTSFAASTGDMLAALDVIRLSDEALVDEARVVRKQELRGVVSVSKRDDAVCCVVGIAITPDALLLTVTVTGLDERNPDHDPCASKLMYISGSSGRYSSRCGLARNQLWGPDPHTGSYAGVLVFSRPDVIMAGDEICFEFGRDSFSTAVVWRVS